MDNPTSQKARSSRRCRDIAHCTAPYITHSSTVLHSTYVGPVLSPPTPRPLDIGAAWDAYYRYEDLFLSPNYTRASKGASPVKACGVDVDVDAFVWVLVYTYGARTGTGV